MKQQMHGNYIQELFALSKEIVKLYDSVIPKLDDKVRDLEPGRNFIMVDYSTFLTFSSIFVHCGNIRKLLIPSKRAKGEAKYIYDYRVRRTENLKQIISLSDLEEITNSKIRNTIEHYDEKLDKISLGVENKKLKKHYDAVISNTILSSKSVIEGRVLYLKTYFIDTAIYKNLDFESNIKSVYKEAQYINNELIKHYPLDYLESAMLTKL
ncbi:hypothetical protein ERX27_07415 [Macrococcus brunensis]|uniref:HEPN AbiU2-like domain-containing protein n=1 Tax=Macrococcus brunensis TaxID=198483 RepID=A0A4V3BDA4_9STAP|nr:hypothetical protein [Macrococcus brunensis]TDL96675.1 hypothetical protein ERX27_07415 [Macrococcus brunensis]